MGAKLVRIDTKQIVDSVLSNDTKTVLKRYKSEYLPIWLFFNKNNFGSTIK